MSNEGKAATKSAARTLVVTVGRASAVPAPSNPDATQPAASAAATASRPLMRTIGATASMRLPAALR